MNKTTVKKKATDNAPREHEDIKKSIRKGLVIVHTGKGIFKVHIAGANGFNFTPFQLNTAFPLFRKREVTKCFFVSRDRLAHDCDII